MKLHREKCDPFDREHVVADIDDTASPRVSVDSAPAPLVAVSPRRGGYADRLLSLSDILDFGRRGVLRVQWENVSYGVH